MLVLYVGALHIFIMQNALADVPPCGSVEWAPWSACSVTCGRGERSRMKQCSSGALPPEETQQTQTEACKAEAICPQDATVRSLLVEGHANATLRDHVIKSSAVYSVTECGLMCLRVLSCKSFNTCSGKSELLCELNSATNYEFEEDFLWKIDCSYYNAINGGTF